MADDKDDSYAVQKSVFFGRDLSDIPCFRKTFLRSISSGLFLGFAYFMLTSKTRQAVHVGYFSFFGISLGYWVYCRYNWAYEKQNVQRLLLAGQRESMFEGTDRDVNRNEKEANVES